MQLVKSPTKNGTSAPSNLLDNPLDLPRSNISSFHFHRDELLPLIHLSWTPLQLLFSSENLFIAERAFAVLRVFAVAAKDFIQRRTLKEAFPAIMKYIRALQVREVCFPGKITHLWR